MDEFDAERLNKQISLHIAKTLKAYRALYCLSRRQAALQFGISQTRLRDLEEPNEALWPLPSVVTAVKLADHMHLSLDTFILGKRN